MDRNQNILETNHVFFSNKRISFSKLILRERDVLISGEKALADLMNKWFANITADLDLKRDNETISNTLSF